MACLPLACFQVDLFSGHFVNVSYSLGASAGLHEFVSKIASQHESITQKEISTNHPLLLRMQKPKQQNDSHTPGAEISSEITISSV